MWRQIASFTTSGCLHSNGHNKYKTPVDYIVNQSFAFKILNTHAVRAHASQRLRRQLKYVKSKCGIKEAHLIFATWFAALERIKFWSNSLHR